MVKFNRFTLKLVVSWFQTYSFVVRFILHYTRCNSIRLIDQLVIVIVQVIDASESLTDVLYALVVMDRSCHDYACLRSLST